MKPGIFWQNSCREEVSGKVLFRLPLTPYFLIWMSEYKMFSLARKHLYSGGNYHYILT